MVEKIKHQISPNLSAEPVPIPPMTQPRPQRRREEHLLSELSSGSETCLGGFQEKGLTIAYLKNQTE